MARRVTVERVDDGLEIRVAHAPLWMGAIGTTFPALAIAIAFVGLGLESRFVFAYPYPVILVSAAALREALLWWRSAETLRLLDAGAIVRVGGDGGGPGTVTSLRLDEEATIRAHGPSPRWALQDLIGIAAVPRIAVDCRGQRIAFGVGIREDEALEVVSLLAASPAFDAARAAELPPVAGVRRIKGAVGGRGGAPSVKQRAQALEPHRLAPLRLAKGVSDLVMLAIMGMYAAFLCFWTDRGIGALQSPALALLCLTTIVPAALRLSRTFFAGTYSAQVLGRAARPGHDVTIRFSLDRHAPVFEWIDIRLQYVRREKRDGSTLRQIFAPAFDQHIVWEGLYRLPESRLPPGPDEHVDAVFSLPADAPATPGGKKAQAGWLLAVTGRTDHGAFAEAFRVIVLPSSDVSA